MKFQTQYNREGFPDRGYEKNEEASMTVPNQSLTVRELVYRFTHNMDLSLGVARSYDDDDDLQFPPDWHRLDISEKMAFIQEKQKEVQDASDKWTAAKNAEEQKKKDAEIQRQVDIKLKAHLDAIQKSGSSAGLTGREQSPAGD